MSNDEDIADKIIALINAHPRSPRKEEILEVLAGHGGGVAGEAKPDFTRVNDPYIQIRKNGEVITIGWATEVGLSSPARIRAILRWFEQHVQTTMDG